MICPYYKNKQVFDGFNKMIEAFGGRPMTEEEFRDPELRNLRQGSDYSAMEAAYRVYNRNGGNFLDLTPDGKPSILYLSLLDHFGGDETKAIVAKSNVYSDEFANWFGDWWGPLNVQGEDVEYGPISKVVDENGEPLIVWHGGPNGIQVFKLPDNNSGLIDFTTLHNIEWADENGYNISTAQRELYNKEGYIENATRPVGVYFAKDQVVSRSYFGRRNEEDDGLYAVYLNIKNPNTTNKNGRQMPDDTGTVKDLQQAVDNNQDGVIIENVRDFGPNEEERFNFETGEFATDATTDYVVFNPNQIKHVENLGTWSTEDNNIYKNVVTETMFPEQSQLDQASLTDLFGQQVMSDLVSGKIVNSKQLVENLLIGTSLSQHNKFLAEILSKHDIPVRIDNTLDVSTLAETVTDENGVGVILINKNTLQSVTSRYASATILHEIIHAVTVNAINNPKTKEERRFAELNRKLFLKMNKLYRENSAALYDFDSGLYALSNEKEFAAVFMTDSIARENFIRIAKLADTKTNKLIKTLKDFINALSELFINKSLFSNNEKLINKYQNDFINYLKNQSAINKKTIPSKSALKAFYDSIDEDLINNEVLIDRMKQMDKAVEGLERNKLINLNWNGVFRKKKSTTEELPSFENVTSALKIRKNALRTSNMESNKRLLLISQAQNQIDLFENGKVPKYQASMSMLKTVIPQLLQDVADLREKYNSDELISSSEYMLNLHSNFGMYEQISNYLQQILLSPENKASIIQEMNKTLGAEQLEITEEDLKELDEVLKRLQTVSSTGRLLCQEMLKRIVSGENGILHKIGEKSGSISMRNFLQNLNDESPIVLKDISWMWKLIGSLDSSSNEALRALAHMVNTANIAAQDESLDRGIKLLKTAQQLKKGEKMTDLYELDLYGKPTGYLIRELNYGRFYKDYDEFLKKLNAKYGLDEEQRIAPNDPNIRVKWNAERNEWLDKHCERKYKKEYYDYWNNIPQDVKEQLDGINIQIRQIEDIIRDEKTNICKYEDLTDELWNKLNELWTEKMLLSSPYDAFGHLKEPGDRSYETYKVLKNLREKLFPSSVKKNKDLQTIIPKDYEGWKKQRESVMEQCGGWDKYNHYIETGELDGFDIKKWNKWEARNTRWEYKRDSDGKAKLFKEIDDAMRGEKPYYGAEYEKLQEQFDDLVKNFKDQRGYVNVLLMSESAINEAASILRKMRDIRNKAIAGNVRLQQIVKKRGEIYDQFVTRKRTDYFQQVYDNLVESSKIGGEIDNYLLAEYLRAYGLILFDEDSFDGDFVFKEFGFLSVTEAKDKEKYMEPTPGKAWIVKEENEDFINPEYKKYEESHPNEKIGQFIPKKSLYDNKKRFDEVMSSTTLKALYDESLSMIDEANKKQTNRTYTDKYLLPQVTGTLYRRLKGARWGNKTKTFFTWLKELLGLKLSENEINIGSDAAVSIIGDAISSGFATESVDSNIGKYPDGRQFNILPQFYTRKLKDPSGISADLVDIIQMYYHMSCGYEQRLKIKDDCETLFDFIKDLKYSKTATFSNKESTTKGDLSNTYESAKKFLEMNMYDIKRTSGTFKLGKLGTLEYGKTALLIKRWTTAKNLGLNPKVAAVGFMTAMYNHIINAITGLKYTWSECWRSMFEVVSNIGLEILNPKMWVNPSKWLVGGYLSDNKIVVGAELFGIANQYERKFKGLNRNILLNNIWRNSTYGFLSNVDFLTKSQIMVSVLKSYKYIEGYGFISIDDVNTKRFELGKEGHKALKEKWEKEKITLYNQYSVEDGKFTVNKKYEKDWLKVKSVVTNRIQKYAEAADGMPTEIQRAAMTQSWLGAFVLIHRNYLPLIIQERFGETVYDYDTEQYKNGQFRLFFKFIFDLAGSNYLTGIGAGALGGFAFGGGGLLSMGVGAAAGLGISIYKKRKNKGNQESTKDVLNRYFKDYSTQEASILTMMNNYFKKQILAELSTYFVARLLIGFLCDYADKKQNKDKWWLLMLAYWSRAFQWEMYTPYRTNDLLNNIKSPTAATSILDSTSSLGNSTGEWFTNFGLSSIQGIYTTIDPQASTFLLDPSLYMTYSNRFTKTNKKGSYAGVPWLARDVIKQLPVHNLWEQGVNSKAKRLYMENEIYKGDY